MNKASSISYKTSTS